MRIRSIRPEFWRSSDISSLPIDTRLLFIGLWSYVDDNGVGVDKLASVVADLFADDMARDSRETLARVSRGLQELSCRSLITRYTVDGRDFLHIRAWDKHQRIDRPGKSRFPLPDAESATIRDTLATPSRDPIDISPTGEGEKGRRGEGEKREGRASRARALPPDWQPPDDVRDAIAAELPDIDIDRETIKFRDHFTANGKTMRDWTAAWRNWMRRAEEYRIKPGRASATKQDRNLAILDAAERRWANADRSTA